jgi:hypothetical protein
MGVLSAGGGRRQSGRGVKGLCTAGEQRPRSGSGGHGNPCREAHSRRDIDSFLGSLFFQAKAGALLRPGASRISKKMLKMCFPIKRYQQVKVYCGGWTPAQRQKKRGMTDTVGGGKRCSNNHPQEPRAGRRGVLCGCISSVYEGTRRRTVWSQQEATECWVPTLALGQKAAKPKASTTVRVQRRPKIRIWPLPPGSSGTRMGGLPSRESTGGSEPVEKQAELDGTFPNPRALDKVTGSEILDTKVFVVANKSWEPDGPSPREDRN